jgi:DNA primase
MRDAGKLREALDVEALLKTLGIVYVKREEDLYSVCPNPQHKDSDPSWHIRAVTGDRKNGVFNCWSCKWAGDVYTLIQAIKRCDFPAAVAFVRELGPSSVPHRPAAELRPVDYETNLRPYTPGPIGFKWRRTKTEPLHTFAPEPILPGSAASEYLLDRWIGPGYITRHNLLDWREQRRIVVPIVRRGILISWVARSYADALPKAIAPEGAPKRWEIFALDQLDRSIPEVHLVEGWVDQIRVSQIGIKNVIAICGSKLTEYQVEEILFAKKIIVWMDGDKAGEVLVGDVRDWFAHRRLLVVRMPDGTDPGDFSPSELLKFKPISFDRRQQCPR